ncbi:hypothetical protein WICPIJ_007583 [Wickerhamomyces pijperi]|uniref:Uncharacterized protein n=1 Tax=Wickerhamomyces pijperi TaxID=599730 RepID=A0A9P8TK95_WICPI|nr:hypothetical protein WICPIJ_007583 [Wickerhamomyces pijperi]
MDWSITPSFVEEPTVAVQVVKVLGVGLASPEVQVTDLEVGPEVAQVVRGTAVVGDEVHQTVLVQEPRVLLEELLGGLPQRWNGLDVLVEGNGEPVLLAVVLHELENIVVNVTVDSDVWLHSPVVVVVHHQLVSVEEPGLVAAHVSVRDGVPVDDLLLLHRFSRGSSLVQVDPFREGPVLLWNQTVLGLTGDQSRGGSDELLGEWLVVEEHPIVAVLGVETVFDVSDRTNQRPQIVITGQ